MTPIYVLYERQFYLFTKPADWQAVCDRGMAHRPLEPALDGHRVLPSSKPKAIVRGRDGVYYSTSDAIRLIDLDNWLSEDFKMERAS